MIKATDNLSYAVVVGRGNYVNFTGYKAAEKYALETNALWIDVKANDGQGGFSLSATVSKIVDGQVIDIHSRYKIG